MRKDFRVYYHRRILRITEDQKWDDAYEKNRDNGVFGTVSDEKKEIYKLIIYIIRYPAMFFFHYPITKNALISISKTNREV